MMNDRTEIAARCLAGMLAVPDGEGAPTYTADEYPQRLSARAVEYADALLAELAKPHAPGPVAVTELQHAADSVRGWVEDGEIKTALRELDALDALVARMKEPAR